MSVLSPTWDGFAWAVFYYGVVSRDITGRSDYLELMRQTRFLQDLRTNPNSLQANDIRQKVIRGFLNRWRCRVKNVAANSIQRTLQSLVPYLRALNNLSIQSIQFNNPVIVGNNNMTISQVIEYCYTQVRNIGYNFGPTATSKLLHILQPDLFVMWDDAILEHYKNINGQISDSGRGYLTYLKMMKRLANHIHTVFQNAVLTPPAHADQDPASYLNAQMGYNPPKTMAKYLDEYNWIKITYGVQAPPAWHP